MFVCLLLKKKLLAEDIFIGMMFVAGMSGFCFLCPQGILMAAVLKVFSDALFPFIILFSLCLLKSSVINLFKPSRERGGRKLTPVTRNERGLIFVDTNVSVVHRTEYRIASSCATQKSAFSKAHFLLLSSKEVKTATNSIVKCDTGDAFAISFAAPVGSNSSQLYLW